MLDAGMIILSALGIGLAMRGKASGTERFLIMICAAASAGMNFAAANPGTWRSVAAYTAAPVFLAIITDRVISVIRRHVLPATPNPPGPGWAAPPSALRLAALVALYLLRTVLAPRNPPRASAGWCSTPPRSPGEGIQRGGEPLPAPADHESRRRAP